MKKVKKIYVAIFIMVLIIVMLYIGAKNYTKNNYDLRVITDNGISFFILETTHKEYYLVNSKIGVKVKTNQFEITGETLSPEQHKYLQKIADIDKFFSLEEYEQENHIAFFYNDEIYYTQSYNTNNTGITEEEKKAIDDYICVYNIKTGEINKIKRQYTGLMKKGADCEALIHLYPDLKDKMNSKEKNGFGLGGLYYKNGRIIFRCYRSTSARGTTECFYEYFPKKQKLKKIAVFHKNVVDFDVVEKNDP